MEAERDREINVVFGEAMELLESTQPVEEPEELPKRKELEEGNNIILNLNGEKKENKKPSF